MKPLTNRLSFVASLIFFPVLILWRKAGKHRPLAVLIALVLFTSCFQHYYRTHTQGSADETTLKMFQNSNKYFIIHFDSNRVLGIENVLVSDSRIEGKLVELTYEHSRYLHPSIGKTNRVRKADKVATLLEVHLYTTDPYINSQQISLPLSSFNRVDAYTFDEKATRTNHILSAVGLVVGVAIVTTTIVAIAAVSAANAAGEAAAGTCNCPRVYINNNGQYQFRSGVYSGAIYSSLERTDYLPLPASAINGNTCQLKVANVQNEKQFINRIQLMQVNHPAGTDVLADRHGNIFSYKDPQGPVAAIANKGSDIKQQLMSTDDEVYLFNGDKGENGFSNVVLTFNKPANASKAKLLIHGGNSLWSGYIYHSFAGLFGDAYDKWREAKDKSDPKEMEQWQTKQKLPIMVYIEKDGQWQFADYFAHTGNTASRDMIMELDVTGTREKEIKIKLETVYQFWKLDFAGIDFSNNATTASTLLNAVSAVKTNGSEEKENLNSCDKSYCHLGSDESVIVQFQVAPLFPSSISSYFLVSSGYYHNVQKYEGKTDFQALNQ